MLLNWLETMASDDLGKREAIACSDTERAERAEGFGAYSGYTMDTWRMMDAVPGML
jgi:hypothetical protein